MFAVIKRHKIIFIFIGIFLICTVAALILLLSVHTSKIPTRGVFV